MFYMASSMHDVSFDERHAQSRTSADEYLILIFFFFLLLFL